jgi:hypothetical protein
VNPPPVCPGKYSIQVLWAMNHFAVVTCCVVLLTVSHEAVLKASRPALVAHGVDMKDSSTPVSGQPTTT